VGEMKKDRDAKGGSLGQKYLEQVRQTKNKPHRVAGTSRGGTLSDNCRGAVQRLKSTTSVGKAHFAE